MMTTYPVRHLSLGIDCAYPHACAYLEDPANFAEWASGLGQGLTPGPTTPEDHTWHAQTPTGPATIQFTPPNPFGILDHTVQPATNTPPVYIPMRLLRNRHGVEILFTLYQHPEMTDRAFAADAATVMADLRRLKSILESRHGIAPLRRSA